MNEEGKRKREEKSKRTRILEHSLQLKFRDVSGIGDLVGVTEVLC